MPQDMNILVEVDDNGEHRVKKRWLNSYRSEYNGINLTPMDQDVMTLLSDDESRIVSQQIPNHIATFPNEHCKVTVQELISCQSGIYRIHAMLEWILGGDNSEANPYNILFGRCLTCGKLEPLETFAVDFQSVGYACCYREGLTEVVRCFNLSLVLYDHTSGLSNGLFARVTSQHAEELLGCSPAKFQSLDDLGRLRVLDRVKGLQRYPMELMVSVRQMENENALECYVTASKIMTKHDYLF